MKSRNRMSALLSVLIGLSVAVDAWANAEAVETGRLLAVLLDSGRIVVAENQSLINDPKKTNKGFTPAFFERQLVDHFKDRMHIDLANLTNEHVPDKAKKLLSLLVDLEKLVVADAQRIINMEGIGFKGFNPTVFASSAVSKLRAYAEISFRQTMITPRNPRNKPDEFEAKMLDKFADPTYPRQGEKILSEVVDGGRAVRVMLPLYYGKSCLACHGEPKGEKDVSGYAKEGRKEGDLGGAISVKLDVK